MAPSAHEQPEESMGRREESSRRAQENRPDNERARGRASGAGTRGSSRGCWWAEEAISRGLDVQRTLKRPGWHYGGDGGIFTGEEAHRWPD